MNADVTKIIADYLAGELSSADQKIFEERMQSSEELRNEVEFQKTIVEAAKRSSIRSQVESASKSFHLNQVLKWTGIAVATIAVITALSILAYQQFSKEEPKDISQFETLIDKFKKEELITNLPSEFFAWNGTDTAMLSKNGILISIPETAFFLNGKPYKEAALIQFQEALDAATIVKSGLSTMADDRLLETQGMFSFTAYSENGEKLTINPKTGIYIQVPVDEYKEGMQLFTGVEDKNGIINWVNPKSLAKIPVPVDMNDLNFYPSGYEDSLNNMKLRKDKKYRDSLYLSCEENKTQKNSKDRTIHMSVNHAFSNKQENIEWSYEIEFLPNNIVNFIYTGYLKDDWYLYHIKQPNKLDEEPKPSSLMKFEESKSFEVLGEVQYNFEPILLDNERTTHYTNRICQFKQKIKIKDPNSFRMILNHGYAIKGNNLTPFITSKNITLLFEKEPEKSQMSNIPPTNVLAFWKPKFNNTNLSTREFEKRMQAVHGTCNNKVLEVYTKNLNKPISELDKQVVKMGYSNFSLFAAENIGAVDPDNPHIKALSDFYENGIKELREEVARNRDKEQKRKDKWDSKVQDERQNENVRSTNRESQAFNEEYTLNHKNVRKQLGRTLGMTIYTNAQISNIDKYVYETTRARKTAEFFDKETGKTARIQYNAFSVEVANPKEYKQIYVYLFPSELNSYQRIARKNGKFDYPLNDAIIYDMAIVGISEKGYSYFQKSKFKEGKLGTVSLEHVSEEKLNASIEQLNHNRISKPMKISDELDWLKTEQKNYVEQKNRQNHYVFKERIKKIAFPCYAAESDTIYAIENENPFEI